MLVKLLVEFLNPQGADLEFFELRTNFYLKGLMALASSSIYALEKGDQTVKNINLNLENLSVKVNGRQYDNILLQHKNQT